MISELLISLPKAETRRSSLLLRSRSCWEAVALVLVLFRGDVKTSERYCLWLLLTVGASPRIGAGLPLYLLPAPSFSLLAPACSFWTLDRGALEVVGGVGIPFLSLSFPFPSAPPASSPPSSQNFKRDATFTGVGVGTALCRLGPAVALPLAPALEVCPSGLPEPALVGGVGRPCLCAMSGRCFALALAVDAGVVRIHLSGSGR